MEPRTSEAKEWGRFAENMAMEYLLSKGYVIRETNWRPKNSHLEVDIICQDGDKIVFAEVKARQGYDHDPADAVDDKKIRRLVRAADMYLSAQPYDFSYRFDIVTVSGSYDNPQLDHLPDAFLPPVNC